MSYLNHVLQPGETVRYQGSVHWILYLPPIFLSVIGAVAAFTGPVGLIVATVCFVDVDQSVLGRLFNYGNVTIHGTGTTLEPFRGIDRPIEFRNQVTAT